MHNQTQFNLIQENDYYKNLWFKVNTGMNRLGFEEKDFLDIYNKNLQDKKIVLMSHMASSSDPKKHSNQEQLSRFNNITNQRWSF